MKQTFKLIIFFVLSFLVKNVKAQYGNGVNGNVTINSPNTIVNQYYQVQSVSTNYIDLQFNTFLNAGKYLLIQTTGTNAGNWEVIEIVSSGNGINHTTNQINTTFSSGNIQLISFPQYDNLTINSGGVITCPAYNATTGTGGVVFFQVQNNFTIDNGQIDVSGKGFPANAAGTGAAGGIGGAGGTGGTIGAHGAIASVPLTGIGYGGNGGYANNNAALGGVANVPTYLGCAATASNASNNSTTPPTLLMGACGYSGNGGNSGQGAGGGGGGAGTTTCNNGDNGGAGGNGGNGGIGGNGGGIIMIHAKNVSYTGSNLFVANGTNGGSATNGSDGGNGGNGGNGCGTVCSSAGGGGGGTGADGGNGGNGGNGAAAGILYIKKASGTNLNSQHYQLNGGVGGNGGNGGVKGLHGNNAPLLLGTNCPPPPFIINGVTYTCYLDEVLNDLSLMGTNAYTTTNISSHEVEYSFNGLSVTINYFSSGSAIIYSSNGYYIYLINNTSSLSIQNILTQILAGNSSITWSHNTTGFITTTTGTVEGLCGTQRATADDGNDGLPGTSGNAGTGTTPFEQTVTCNDITLSEMQFVYACTGFFDIQGLIDNAVNQFNAQSSEPALNAQITGGNGFNSLIVTATTASGCILTMNYSIMEFDNNVQVSLLNVSNASCGTSDGSATFNITDYGHIQSSGGFNYQLVNATGSIVQSGFSSTIPFVATNLSAGNYSFYVANCMGQYIAYDVCTITENCCTNTASTTNLSICNSQLPYTWNGLTFTSAGTQTAHLTNAAGCDSAATLDLTVNLPTTSTVSYELCSSQFPFYYNGESFDKCGEYTVIIPNSVGCDSIITLSLICATKYEDIYETVCYKILPYVWNGTSLTTAGTYSYQTTSVGGCDSIVTLDLIVDYPTSSTTNISACNSYTWNGTTYTQSGTYVFVTTNAAQCGDSIATLNLTINQPTSSTTKITICGSSYTWNNNTYTASGIYTVTLINSVGCDSIATLKLTLGDHSSSNTYVTICDNAAPYIWNGQSYNASGLYTYTTINSVGCDSVAKLYLTINATSKSFTYITHCGSSFNWNGNTYNATGNYVVHFTNSVGCDSAAILILTLAAPTSSTTIVSGCLAASSFTMGTIALPYIWNGNSYNTSGSYTVHLTNAAGCDSAATLILNILQPTTSTTNLTICSNQLPYTWNGLTFTSAGTQTAHLTNAAGCDSAATLILIVNTPTTSTTNLTICNNQLPYTWNGLTFTSAGTQTAHLTNVAGCDSAATLILTTSTVSIGSKTIASVCQNNLPYSWMGTNYYTAGTYKVFHPSTGSTCSYEDTLILSVKDTSWMHFLQNICSSQLPYTWGLQVITTAGTYIQTFTKQNGCDSLVYLTIQIENCSSLPIVGNKVICLNSSNQTQLSNVNVGGYWVSSNSSIATVSNTGLVTAYNQGIVTIYYVYTVGSIQYVLSTIVTITTVPVFTINGPSSICVGDRPQFTTLPAQTGGTWSSLYTIRATINATTGEAQGINAGSTVIKYSLPTTCGPVSVVFATKPLVVNAKPPVPNIGYASGYPNPRSCAGGLYKVGAVFGLIGYPSGGTWSATPANVVTINNLGVVTVTGVGTGSITYTYTNANGCSNSKTLTGTTMACRPATLLNTEIASIGYSLYPNPASNVVHVKVSDLIGVNTVTITDILGRKIKQQNISIGDNLIDISHLGKGTYLLTIGTTDKQFVEKLVVQ